MMLVSVERCSSTTRASGHTHTHTYKIERNPVIYPESHSLHCSIHLSITRQQSAIWYGGAGTHAESKERDDTAGFGDTAHTQ